MTVTDNEQGRAALRALAQAYVAVFNALERDLRNRAGLPLTWFEVLLRVGEAPEGALRMQDLADQVRLSRSGVTRLVNRLVETGLIQRDDCADDGRGCYAVLTEAGRKKLEEVWPHFTRAVDEHFASQLNESEARLVQSALTKVVDAIDRGAIDTSAHGPRPVGAG